MVHTLSPEGELLPPRHGEHQDDEDGHRRMIPPLAGCRNGSRLVFGGYGGFWQRNSRSIVLSRSFSVYGNI